MYKKYVSESSPELKPKPKSFANFNLITPLSNKITLEMIVKHNNKGRAFVFTTKEMMIVPRGLYKEAAKILLSFLK